MIAQQNWCVRVVLGTIAVRLRVRPDDARAVFFVVKPDGAGLVALERRLRDGAVPDTRSTLPEPGGASWGRGGECYGRSSCLRDCRVQKRDVQADRGRALAPYVPPPAYHAPMPYDPPPPPNVSGCVSYNGRWINAAGCN